MFSIFRLNREVKKCILTLNFNWTMVLYSFYEIKENNFVFFIYQSGRVDFQLLRIAREIIGKMRI